MRKISRLAAFVLVGIMIFAFAGCGKKDGENKNGGRSLYDGVKLEKYATVGEYLKFKVDTESEDYKKILESERNYDADTYSLYKDVTEGRIENGDNANIDYVGKKDGVAFDGGSAQKFDLKIGSHSFIPGFEEGLVGKEIGSTVDLNLTFPKDYHEKTLAGAPVVFTVKINSVKKQMTGAEAAQKLNFKSEEDYTESLNIRAKKSALLDMLVKSAKIKNYPKDELEKQTDTALTQMETVIKQQGMTLDQYLQYSGMSLEKFKSDLQNKQVKPIMDMQIPVYYLIDKEKLELTQKDIDEQFMKVYKPLEEQGVRAEQLKEVYGEEYFEFLAAQNIVKEFLYAKTK